MPPETNLMQPAFKTPRGEATQRGIPRLSGRSCEGGKEPITQVGDGLLPCAFFRT